MSSSEFENKLTDCITQGERLREREIRNLNEEREFENDFFTWDEFNVTLLKQAFSTNGPRDNYIGSSGMVLFDNDDFCRRAEQFREELATKLRRLQSLKEQLTLYEYPVTIPPLPPGPLGTDIFVVHGHDEALKLGVATTVERLTGTWPTILHEMADSGRTIIEKFESHAGAAAFAVVLLTADDRGGQEDELRPRARQNVIFELGYFIGQLGRSRVAVLYSDGVELPSDMNGVLYTPADKAGAWRLKLAREMKAAGIPTDLNQLT